eukprot:SAG22_NODE_15814_length_339_cov_731.025000_1_plen_88_part_01
MSVSTRLPGAWRCHLAGDYLVLPVQPLRQVEVVKQVLGKEVKEIQVEVVKQVEVVQVEEIRVEVVQVKQVLGKEVEEIRVLVEEIRVE